MNTFEKIAYLMLELAKEGVPVSATAVHEAALVVLVSKARTARARKELRVLYSAPASAVAELRGVSRRTITRQRKKMGHLCTVTCP